ncbi:MAG TPA: DUF6508 domain-containing protein [Candidatus Saccharimonas sp.]|nr:DUF6508 domain-containing protein [Candidatus Saccharimonas sp.]
MSEWDDTVKNLSNDDWQQIEELNSQIQSHTGSWGKMEGGDKDESGAIQMPYASPDPLVHKFLEVWYDKDLVIPFDWSEWDEGREWYTKTDESKYDSLNFETALKLLTAVIRNDRFNEGALMNAFESGDFPKIINKFVSLRDNS